MKLGKLNRLLLDDLYIPPFPPPAFLSSTPLNGPGTLAATWSPHLPERTQASRKNIYMNFILETILFHSLGSKSCGNTQGKEKTGKEGTGKVRPRGGENGQTGRRSGFRGVAKAQEAKKKTAPHVLGRTAGRKDANIRKNGGDLLSHGYAVPSARTGLTALFGMGRGGTPAL